MKQHIELADLNQLTDRGRERLRVWWKPAPEHWCYYPEKETTILWAGVISRGLAFSGMVSQLLPLLSIGQMIELISENNSSPSYIDNDFDYTIWRSGASFPKVEIGWFGYNELCDALWEECVEILNK